MKWDKGGNSPGAVQTAADVSAGVINIMKKREPDSAKKALDYWRQACTKNLNN